MLYSSDNIFISENPQVGILGKLTTDRKGIHVGFYWIHNNSKKFLHFIQKGKIELNDPNELLNYYGLEVPEFKKDLIPSLISFTKLIQANNLGTISVNLTSVIYKGNKFRISDGKYIVDKEFENSISCGVFVLALFETYNHTLLKWESWPTVTDANKNPYLQFWLEEGNIPDNEQEPFYNFNKEIKGKHVISSTLVKPNPSEFEPIEKVSNEVFDFFLSKNVVV